MTVRNTYDLRHTRHGPQVFPHAIEPRGERRLGRVEILDRGRRGVGEHVELHLRLGARSTRHILSRWRLWTRS